MAATTTTAHPVDEPLPLPRLAAFGSQPVMVMYAGAVAGAGRKPEAA